MRRVTGAALASVLLVSWSFAACAADAPMPEPSPTPYAAPASSALPSDLLGNWHVSNAAGEEAGAWIAIGELESVLHRECGEIDFAWNAAPDVVIFDLTGGAGHCLAAGSDLPVVSWLTDARSFAVDGPDLVILNADGFPTATLTADSSLPGIDRPSNWRPWHVSAGDLDLFPSLLSDDHTAATARALLGSWVPEGWSGGFDPTLTFTPDGHWRGHDCNGAGGEFLVAPGGLLLSTDSGMRTLVGCLDPVYGMDMVLFSVRRAAIDGDRLSLFDQNGTLLAELIREV